MQPTFDSNLGYHQRGFAVADPWICGRKFERLKLVGEAHIGHPAGWGIPLRYGFSCILWPYTYVFVRVHATWQPELNCYCRENSEQFLFLSVQWREILISV